MKYIYQLTDDEKRELIENNNALANMVYDDMIDDEMHFITEQLNYIAPGLRDYQIGSYNHDYMIVGNSVKFLDGLETLQKKLLHITGRHAARNRPRFGGAGAFLFNEL